jgi:NAD(P)H-hydrate repair Nnr-like enzyme with NAD(P)H-hydrate epimerase domain
MRSAEQGAIDAGTSVEQLMERQGRRRRSGLSVRGSLPTLILCGPGNNGGDGVAARYLSERYGRPRCSADEPEKRRGTMGASQWQGEVEIPGDRTQPRR